MNYYIINWSSYRCIASVFASVGIPPVGISSTRAYQVTFHELATLSFFFSFAPGSRRTLTHTRAFITQVTATNIRLITSLVFFIATATIV